MNLQLSPQRSIYGLVLDTMLYATTSPVSPPPVSDGTVKVKVLKPRSDVPLIDLRTGLISPQWDRWFSDVFDVRLGGALGPSLPQVQANVVETQAASSVAIAALTQSVEINAASTAAAIEVAQTNNTPGAEEIPPPVLVVPPEPSPPRSPPTNHPLPVQQ